MTFQLLWLTLRTRRLAILWFSVGLFIYGLLIMGLWPSFQTIDYASIIESLPEGMQKIYREVNVDGLSIKEQAFYQFVSGEWATWVVIIAAYFGIWIGASVVARDFANGTLDVLLAPPIGRTKFILIRAFAVLIGGTLLVAASLVSVVIGANVWVSDIDLNMVDLGLMHLQLWLFTLATAGIGLMMATLVLRPGRTYGLCAFVIVAMFLLNIVATIVTDAEWAGRLTLFEYWNPIDQLTHSEFAWRDALVLGGVALVTSTVAVGVFRRRDIVA